MAGEDGKQSEVILTATAPTGGKFDVFVRSDGCYGIARDGLEIDGKTWQAGDLKGCVIEFIKLAGLS